MDDEAQKPDQVRDLEMAVDETIIACGGDTREAIKALLVANSYLEQELEMISYGYARGRISVREAS